MNINEITAALGTRLGSPLSVETTHKITVKSPTGTELAIISIKDSDGVVKITSAAALKSLVYELVEDAAIEAPDDHQEPVAPAVVEDASHEAPDNHQEVTEYEARIEECRSVIADAKNIKADDWWIDSYDDGGYHCGPLQISHCYRNMAVGWSLGIMIGDDYKHLDFFPGPGKKPPFAKITKLLKQVRPEEWEEIFEVARVAAA